MEMNSQEELRNGVMGIVSRRCAGGCEGKSVKIG